MQKIVTLLCVTACLFSQAALVEGQPRDPFSGAFDALDSAFGSQGVYSQSSEATLQDAYYLGRAVAANILAVYKPYTANAALTAYLNRICRAIAINSPQPELFNGYHVMILDSAEFNAFASPGGHIFVTKKLVETAASEDMLAAVIAHEMAHIMLRHGLGIIDDMSLAGEAASMANQAAALSGNSASAKRLLQYRNSTAKLMDTLMKNGYSKDQEFEADRYAAALLVDAGYDPKALPEMLKILQRVQSASKGGFNTTHPSPAQRVANVEKLRFRTQDTRQYREARFNNK